MDAATIQTKVYQGYARSAAFVGQAFQLYRPSSAAAPIAPASLIGPLNASLTVRSTSGFNFNDAPQDKDALFNALLDGSQTQVGDYLVGVSDTYFIASQQPLLPIMCVRCTRTLTISNPGPAQGFGVSTAYGGTTPANEVPVMTSWPASLLFDARGRATEVGLPTDLPSPYFVILMPALASVDVRTSQIITDDLGRRYVISATEQTPLGWRISAQQAVT